jgi:glycine/D-amino acid oxidase-like deaminating enzyme
VNCVTDTLPPIEQACFWMARRRPRRPPEPLQGREEVDVAIVGGGYTGLWTAIFLKELEPRRKIALLEQELVGYGGSGRNAGIVGETLDHSHELAIAHFGLDEARRLARLGRENLDAMETFLRERGIDAGFERPGQLVVALSPDQVGALEKGREAAERVGSPGWRVLSREEARTELVSPLYEGALLAPRNGVVDPLRLTEGLRLVAAGAGVRIHERTRVTSLAFRKDRAEVRTAGGAVAARKLVLATNAYSHHLRRSLVRRFVPLYDYILVSDPLTPAQRRSIGWTSRRPVVDTRTFFNYYRLTDDGRILWGTSEAAYYPRNRVGPACDHSPRHYDSLEESFRRHFPQLGGLTFPYRWGGPIASTTRLTPFFGSAHGGRLHYGLGYTGHGIASTRVAGRILAHRALELPSALLELSMVRKRPVPYPPEPLRRAAVALVTGALRRVDAGRDPGVLLRALDRLGIGFSS